MCMCNIVKENLRRVAFMAIPAEAFHTQPTECCLSCSGAEQKPVNYQTRCQERLFFKRDIVVYTGGLNKHLMFYGFSHPTLPTRFLPAKVHTNRPVSSHRYLHWRKTN